MHKPIAVAPRACFVMPHIPAHRITHFTTKRNRLASSTPVFGRELVFAGHEPTLVAASQIGQRRKKIDIPYSKFWVSELVKRCPCIGHPKNSGCKTPRKVSSVARDSQKWLLCARDESIVSRDVVTSHIYYAANQMCNMPLRFTFIVTILLIACKGMCTVPPLDLQPRLPVGPTPIQQVQSSQNCSLPQKDTLRLRIKRSLTLDEDTFKPFKMTRFHDTDVN